MSLLVPVQMQTSPGGWVVSRTTEIQTSEAMRDQALSPIEYLHTVSSCMSAHSLSTIPELSSRGYDSLPTQGEASEQLLPSDL